MTIVTAREICRFVLAMVTVMMLWSVVTSINAGGWALLPGSRDRVSCSAQFSALTAPHEGETTAAGTVKR